MALDERRYIAVAVRVRPREYGRWQRAADLEDLRVVELVREAVRAHVRELERLRLLRASEPGRERRIITRSIAPPTEGPGIDCDPVGADMPRSWKPRGAP